MWTLQRGALLRFFAIGNLQISQHSPRLTPEYVLQRSLLERTPWLGAGEDAAQICSLTRGVCRDVCERSIHSFPPRNASSGKTYLASFKYEFVCFLPDCISTAGVGSPTSYLTPLSRFKWDSTNDAALGLLRYVFVMFFFSFLSYSGRGKGALATSKRSAVIFRIIVTQSCQMLLWLSLLSSVLLHPFVFVYFLYAYYTYTYI